MTKITREDVIKLANLSKIEIQEHEVDSIVKQLQDVLTYAVRVKEIASDIKVESYENINIFAEDVIIKCDPEPILSQAPEREENYFVVPKILENQ